MNRKISSLKSLIILSFLVLLNAELIRRVHKLVVLDEDYGDDLVRSVRYVVSSG